MKTNFYSDTEAANLFNLDLKIFNSLYKTNVSIAGIARLCIYL